MEHKLIKVENNDPDITYIITLSSTEEREQQMIDNYLLLEANTRETKFIEDYCNREFNKKQFYLIDIAPEMDCSTIRLEFIKSA
ncbi:MAG: hypothetical protein IPP77_04515 [Bacteroidetes bacterium]|nr:hypothetical protein [Bacteroidota bacterium]